MLKRFLYIKSNVHALNTSRTQPNAQSRQNNVDTDSKHFAMALHATTGVTCKL